MPSFNPVICIGQWVILKSKFHLWMTFDPRIYRCRHLCLLISFSKWYDITLYQFSAQSYVYDTCYVHILWLTFEWPLTFEPLPTELWSNTKCFSKRLDTSPCHMFKLPTSFSSWDIRLLLFIEKWAWPNNHWPRPLKNYTALYCTLVPTHPPNFRKICPTIVEETLTEPLCKEKERKTRVVF